jgi:hypothetical protein
MLGGDKGAAAKQTQELLQATKELLPERRLAAAA